MSDQPAERETIPLFTRGVWSVVPLPIEGAVTFADASSETLERSGYYRLTGLGPAGDHAPIELTVWEGPGGVPRNGEAGSDVPRYLIDIGFPSNTHVVAAMDVVDLMDVVARWAPALDAAVQADESAERMRQRIKMAIAEG